MRPNKHTRRRALAVHIVPALLAMLSWSWAPAQVPVAGAVPSGTKRIEENDPSVLYTGVWYPQHRSDLSANCRTVMDRDLAAQKSGKLAEQ